MISDEQSSSLVLTCQSMTAVTSFNGKKSRFVYRQPFPESTSSLLKCWSVKCFKVKRWRAEKLNNPQQNIHGEFKVFRLINDWWPVWWSAVISHICWRSTIFFSFRERKRERKGLNLSPCQYFTSKQWQTRSDFHSELGRLPRKHCFLEMLIQPFHGFFIFLRWCSIKMKPETGTENKCD